MKPLGSAIQAPLAALVLFAPLVRARACQGLEGLGIVIDSRRNARRTEGIQDISTTDSRMKVLVVPTDEELRIAQETKKAVAKSAG